MKIYTLRPDTFTLNFNLLCQVVLCGDFYQLPPIHDEEYRFVQLHQAVGVDFAMEEGEASFLNRGFAFQSRAWKAADLHQCTLDKVFRQKEALQVDTLNSIRTGTPLTPDQLQLLRKIPQALPPREDGIHPTILFGDNASADGKNLIELKKLPYVQTEHLYNIQCSEIFTLRNENLHTEA